MKAQHIKNNNGNGTMMVNYQSSSIGGNNIVNDNEIYI